MLFFYFPLVSGSDSFLVVSQLEMIRGYSLSRNDHAEGLVPIATPGEFEHSGVCYFYIIVFNLGLSVELFHICYSTLNT